MTNLINIGITANDNTGTPVRDSFMAINAFASSTSATLASHTSELATHAQEIASLQSSGGGGSGGTGSTTKRALFYITSDIAWTTAKHRVVPWANKAYDEIGFTSDVANSGTFRFPPGFSRTKVTWMLMGASQYQDTRIAQFVGGFTPPTDPNSVSVTDGYAGLSRPIGAVAFWGNTTFNGGEANNSNSTAWFPIVSNADYVVTLYQDGGGSSYMIPAATDGYGSNGTGGNGSFWWVNIEAE